MKIFIITLLITNLIQIIFSQVNLIQFTSSTNYSLDTSNYTFNFDFSGLLNSSNITINIGLPVGMQLVACVQSCTRNSTTFYFMYIQSQSSFSFLVKNPYLNGSYTISIYILQITTVLNLNINSINVTILPQPMTVSISSSNNNVGSLATFNISILPQTQIYNGSQLYLIFPEWIPTKINGYFSNFSCTVNNSIPVGCNFLTSTSKVILYIPSLYPFNTTGNTYLQLQNFKNPSSTYPYTIQGILQYNNITFSSFNIILTVKNPASTTYLIPNFQSQASSISNTNISIYLNLYFPPGGYINITYDPTLDISFSNIGGYTVTANLNTLLIGGINNGTSSITGFQTLSSFYIINPNIGKTISINITTQYILNGTVYFIESAPFIVSLTPNNFAYININQNQSQTYSNNSITFNITISTQLNGNQSGNNAYLMLKFLNQYTLTFASCFNLSNNSTCSIQVSQSNLQILTGNLQLGTILKFRIDGIINPRYASSYNIIIASYTYFYDNFYIAQYNTSTLLTQPSGINVISSSNNTIVGASVMYTITINTFIQNNQIVRFFQQNSTTTQLQNSTNFTWNNLYQAWQYKVISDLNSLTFQFQTNNPNTLTNSCILAPITIYNTSNYIYATNSTPFCPNITTLGKIYSILQSKNTTLSGVLAQVIITLTFNVPYSTGDILQITFPALYNLTNFNVTGLYGINNNLYFTQNNNSISIVMVFGIFPLNSSITLQLLYNNSYVSGNFPISFNTFNKNLYGKETGTIYETISTNVGNLTYSSINLNTNQNINFSLALPFSVNSAILQIYFKPNPNYYNYSISTCTSLSQNQSCLYLPLNQQFQITNITNNLVNFSINFSFFYFDTFQAIFNTYYNSSLSTSLSINLSSFCGWHCQNCSSTASKSCYNCFSSIYTNYILYSPSNMLCYSQCPNATYRNGNYCYDCMQGCSNCISDSICSVCNLGYNLINTTCISICRLGQYYLNEKCLNCPLNCQTCNQNKCTNCSAGAIFMNSSCIFLNCTNNCLTCSVSQSNCTSCISGYFYNYNCYNICPLGMSTDLTNKICLQKPYNNLAKFPYLIFSGIIFFTIVGSKLIQAKTDVMTLMVAILGISQMLCMLSLVGSVTITQNTPFVIGIICVIIYMIANIINLGYYIKILRIDEYYEEWIKQNIKNKVSSLILLVLSTLISFKIFRIVYSRFLGRTYFSAKFQSNQKIFYFTNILTGFHYLFFCILALVCAGIALNNSTLGSQIFFFSIEMIIICCLSNIFCLLDIKKEPKYFENTQNNQINNTEEQSKNSMGALINTLQNIHQSSQISEQADFSKNQFEPSKLNNKIKNEMQLNEQESVHKQIEPLKQQQQSKIKLKQLQIQQIQIKQKNNEVSNQQNIEFQHPELLPSSISINNDQNTKLIANNQTLQHIITQSNVIDKSQEYHKHKPFSKIKLNETKYQQIENIQNPSQISQLKQSIEKTIQHPGQSQLEPITIQHKQNQIRNDKIKIQQNIEDQQNISAQQDRYKMEQKRVATSPIQYLHNQIEQQIKIESYVQQKKNQNIKIKNNSSIQSQGKIKSKSKSKSKQKSQKIKNIDSVIQSKKQSVPIPKNPKTLKKRLNKNQIKKQTKLDDLFLGFLNQESQSNDIKHNNIQNKNSSSLIQKNNNQKDDIGRYQYNQEAVISIKDQSDFTSNHSIDDKNFGPRSDIKFRSMTYKPEIKTNLEKTQEIQLEQKQHKPSLHSKTFSNRLYKNEI